MSSTTLGGVEHGGAKASTSETSGATLQAFPNERREGDRNGRVPSYGRVPHYSCWQKCRKSRPNCVRLASRGVAWTSVAAELSRMTVDMLAP